MRWRHGRLFGLLVMLASGGANADVSLHLAGDLGLSYGGDTLAKLDYSNGTKASIKAGGLLYFNAGPCLEFKGTPLVLQSLLGYQEDTASASNGDVTFDTTTLDTIAFYRMGNHRLGLGLSQHFAPTYKQSAYYSPLNGAYSPQVEADFRDANGPELEYQYRLPQSHVGLSLRTVFLNYKLKRLEHDGVPVSGGKSNVDGGFIAAAFYLYL